MEFQRSDDSGKRSADSGKRTDDSGKRLDDSGKRSDDGGKTKKRLLVARLSSSSICKSVGSFISFNAFVAKYMHLYIQK